MPKKISYMYSHKNLVHLLTILEAIEKIFLYTNSFSDAEEFYFANKQLNFNATVNLLIAIGEESKKIDNNLKDLTDMDWGSVGKLRDKIAHNYRGIDDSIVWDIVCNHLPKLKKASLEMIPKIEEFKLYIEKAIRSGYYEELNYLEKFL